MKIFNSIKNTGKFFRSLKRTDVKVLKYLFFISLTIITLYGCKKEDDTDNKPVYDHSLIISRGSGAKIVLTNPVDGKDLYMSIPSPAVDDVKSLKAGYMCKKAVFIAKTSLKDYTMSIYTCDAKTGANTKAITGDDLYVQHLGSSPVAAEIAFTAKLTDVSEYFQLYTINEDGGGQAHISQPLEQVSGLDNKEYELLDTKYPAYSPDGLKIAFNADVDNLYSVPNSIFYGGIMVMNKDGSNKEFLYWENGKDISISDICWTHDGNFLLFVILDNDNNFHRRVKALNIAGNKVTDLTSALEINGVQVYDISTSPNSDRIVFNQHLGGGSDLFIAEYEIHDDVLTIKGSPVRLSNRESTGYSYYTPSWQLWDEN